MNALRHSLERAVVPVAVAALVAGGAVGLAGPAAAVQPAAPSTAAATATDARTVDGTVVGVDARRRLVWLHHGRGTVRVSVAPGAGVQVHGSPVSLRGVRRGMTVFAEGHGPVRGFVAARVWALQAAGPEVVVIGRVATVDPAGATVVLETGPQLRAVVLVPGGTPILSDGRPTTLAAAPVGWVATVRARPDASTPAELVAGRVALQSADSAPDLRGTLSAVDARHRRLTLTTPSGSDVCVAVPVTAPVLASGTPYPIGYLELGAAIRVRWARDASGRVRHTADGTPVARLVADDQLV